MLVPIETNNRLAVSHTLRVNIDFNGENGCLFQLRQINNLLPVSHTLCFNIDFNVEKRMLAPIETKKNYIFCFWN